MNNYIPRLHVPDLYTRLGMQYMKTIVSCGFWVKLCPVHACPDSKVHGANVGPTWVLSAPDGPHVGPMDFAIRVVILVRFSGLYYWCQTTELPFFDKCVFAGYHNIETLPELLALYEGNREGDSLATGDSHRKRPVMWGFDDSFAAGDGSNASDGLVIFFKGTICYKSKYLI